MSFKGRLYQLLSFLQSILVLHASSFVPLLYILMFMFVLYSSIYQAFVTPLINMFWMRHKDTTEQEGPKVSELRDGLESLSERSSKFCSDACLRRYLEARNWNVNKAKKMLNETLKWRSIYKPEEIRWSEVADEGETGKVSRPNFQDRDGRPILIMRPGKQNTTSPEGNLKHLIYLIENAILNLPEGEEQMSWLIDFNGWTLNTNIPISTAREIIYVLQNHYPERLAIIILYNPPKFFEAFYTYFLDTKTSEKVKFVYPNNKGSKEVMKAFFDTKNLPIEFGGNATLHYDHQEFSLLMKEDDVKTTKFWAL